MLYQKFFIPHLVFEWWNCMINSIKLKKVFLSMHEYFASMKARAHHLLVIGESIPHKDLVMYILHWLCLNYRKFITSLNMRQTEPNLFELQSIFMREEQLNIIQLKANELHIFQVNFVKMNTKSNSTQFSIIDNNFLSHRS